MADLIKLSSAFLAIVSIKADVVLNEEAESFFDLFVAVVIKHPWIYRFIKTALAYYQKKYLTDDESKLLHDKFEEVIKLTSDHETPNYTYLVTSIFPEL